MAERMDLILTAIVAEEAKKHFPNLFFQRRTKLRTRLQMEKDMLRERVLRELKVISATGMTETFLTAIETVRWSKVQNDPACFSLGRGSLPGSMVAPA